MNHLKHMLSIFLLFVSLLTCPSPVPASKVECDFQQVSKRIHVIVGSNHETCPLKALEHPVTNPSIIIGEAEVIVIDPGSSLQVGRLVADRINTLTEKPVTAIMNTHIHGLYWLGNQAIREKYPDAQVYAHTQMTKRIRNGEGAYWVNTITGQYKGEKTQYILPDIELQGGELKTIAGLKIKIHHTGHAHTDHDIMIEIIEESALFLGGIVVEPETPSEGVPQDANFKGQIAATQYAVDLGAKIYIPGRGEPSNSELPKRALNFLKALYHGVERYYDEGLADFEITEKLKKELVSYGKWYDFTRLGGVVSQIYLQVEQDAF